MAVCGIMAALSVVLMVLGAALQLGVYAAPLFAGLCFMPVGQKYGFKYQWMLYAVSAVLCLLFVPDIETNLMFIGLFGWYPIVRPSLQKLSKFLRIVVKFFIFNISVIGIQWLVITVLVPETLSVAMLWLLLALFNITFLAYELMFPKMETLFVRISKLL